VKHSVIQLLAEFLCSLTSALIRCVLIGGIVSASSQANICELTCTDGDRLLPSSSRDQSIRANGSRTGNLQILVLPEALNLRIEGDSRPSPDDRTPIEEDDLKPTILGLLLVGGLVRFLTSPQYWELIQKACDPLNWS
jgi:hypothetical protein